jgi:hypothetical protein
VQCSAELITVQRQEREARGQTITGAESSELTAAPSIPTKDSCGGGEVRNWSSQGPDTVGVLFNNFLTVHWNILRLNVHFLGRMDNWVIWIYKAIFIDKHWQSLFVREIKWKEILR